jgi:hypothetical protein
VNSGEAPALNSLRNTLPSGADTVIVTPEFEALTSHLTLDPLLAIEASFADCPNTETLKQTTTNTAQSKVRKHLRFFIRDLRHSASMPSIAKGE